MRYVSSALAVILLILVIIFAVQNLASTDVAFLAWSISVPKVILILGTYVLGMLSGWGALELLKRMF
jgi:uncharacterized integral membrane protein